MKCVICHGEEIETRKVREEYLLGDDVVYVPVEVPVCRSCGERYHDRKTMRYLEEVQDRLKAKTAHLVDIGRVRILAA